MIKKFNLVRNFSISIEIFNLARKFQSRRLDFPTKKRAAVGGSLENFNLARNFQSRSKSRFFFDLWALSCDVSHAIQRRGHLQGKRLDKGRFPLSRGGEIACRRG